MKTFAFYERLPQQFTRQIYLQIDKEIGIVVKTADKYITLFSLNLLRHDYNSYEKINI